MVETGGIQFIGATPRTDWLPAEIERDPKGFVRSGAALAESRHWELARPPFLLETSHPECLWRVMCGRRVGSAVGEGAMSVQFVHEYLRGM